MRVVVITPPAPVVTWEEADQHLRLDGDDEQRDMVERLIAAATHHIDGPDGWLGRALGLQTLEARICGFCDLIRLPYQPIVDIVSVHYLDGTGQPVLVDPDTYELFCRDLGCAWGKSWPTPGAYRGHAETVRIRYRAGYAIDPDADPVKPNVPEPIKQAILLMVGDMWHARATIATGAVMQAVPMSMTVQNILSPFRVYV
ncbi:hypothetical protein P7B04_07025 [Sphingobium yanoikuyae]|uniref:head-tail connector protein n=1 Tax=Sphingobium yanoikuyae TaxID=13690 RepID=UPI00240EE1D0|nr:hypothetical protein [Sphingobium yanoikuyae]MDG2512448.1 hypothetical protein [Sphingobium yanoikuyae]